jgi:uncharacterized protein (DUF1501 family)
MTVSRRCFLQGLGLVAGATVASPLLSVRTSYAATPTYSGAVLVVLSLRGGFDGLSAVAPVGDPGYALARPTIAVPPSRALPTGDTRFGLHPALAPLKPLWDAGTMAAVHAVGTPDESRSHFQATAELERAAPGSSLRTGWLDRVLAAGGSGTPFQAVQLGDTSPSGLLAGPEAVLAAESLKDFSLSGSSWLGPRFATALTALHQGVQSPAIAPAQITLAALDAAATLVKNDATPKNGAAYPSGELGKAMADVARLVRGAQGLRAVSIDVGSWDMHQGLGAAGDGDMAERLGELAAALAAFATDLGPTLFARVTVITMSEFGRRVQENGSGGVDHGHGNAVLVLGGGLDGGKVHGTWPGLDDASLDDGDLAGTTDYRSVLAELLVKRQGMSSSVAGSVFPSFAAVPVGLFR